MNVIVTGGAGFIGSHLVERLLKNGETVTVVDDFSAGTGANLVGGIAGLAGPNLRLVTGRAQDREVMEPLFENVELVFHLAALVGVDRVCRDPGGTIDSNIKATRVVSDLCRKHSAKLVFTSTAEVYGKSQDLPLREEADSVLGPTTVPRWAYAVSKLADEHLLASLSDGLAAVVVRYFNCYGPRHDPYSGGVIAHFIEKALLGEPIKIIGTGRQTRSFTYVDDAVAGTLAAASAGAGTFNIGYPRETSIADLAGIIKELTGSKSRVDHISPPPAWGTFEEQYHRRPDVSRARDVLGFEARVPLRTGLTETIEWVKTFIADTGLKEAG